jgi:hypothetical protein
VRWFVLAAMAVAVPARADGPTAEQLFEEGRKLLDAHDGAGACERFQRARELAPDALGPMLNLGLCHEMQDHLASALHWYRRAQVRASELRLAESENTAKDKKAELVARVPKLAITATPATAKITVDGVAPDRLELAHLEVDAGHHVVAATAAGMVDTRVEIDIADGDTRPIALVLAPPPKPPPPVIKTTITIDHGAAQRHRARVIGVIGASVLGADAILAGVAYHEYKGTEHPLAQGDWKNVARYGATSLLAGGVATVGVAAWLYLRAPKVERRETIVTPAVAGDRVGVWVMHAF